MRWVEGDTVKLSSNSHEASEQARKALQERFPNAWRWYVGFEEPGVLHSEQIHAILTEGEKPEEVENWQADYAEVRKMVQFLARNWVEAGRVYAFNYEDWECIFNALRYCAHEIHYLPKTHAEEVLREYSRELSARLIAEGYIRPPAFPDVNMGDPPIYDFEWMTIFHACQYCWKHMPKEDPKMAEFRERLERVVPDLLNRVKHHHMGEWTRQGIKDMDIHKRLNEVIVEPWNHVDRSEREQNLYRELRKLQGDEDWETLTGYLHVLNFHIRSGAMVEVYDDLGNYLGSENVDPEDRPVFRDWDLLFAFHSDNFVFRGSKGKRYVVPTDDVDIVEENCSRNEQQVPDWMKYIYANYKVAKYEPKKD